MILLLILRVKSPIYESSWEADQNSFCNITSSNKKVIRVNKMITKVTNPLSFFLYVCVFVLFQSVL